MTKHDLKELAAMGAELGAAKAENEKLREVLRCIADLPMDRCSTENDYRLSAAKAIALGALSQQAEPIEQAPAQDERIPCDVMLPPATRIKRGCSLSTLLTAMRQRESFPTNQQVFTCPAQTEQQPVGYQFQDREGVWKQFMSEKHYEDTLADGTWPIRAIYAAPVAQPAQTELVEALRIAVEYLDSNELNSIASGSTCHRKMRNALAAQGGEA